MALNYSIRFRKRDGSTFTKFFHTPRSAARAARGWRAAGGKIQKVGRRFKRRA